MKVENVELIESDMRNRIEGGVHIKFTSVDNVRKRDLFRMRHDNSIYYFEAVEIAVDGDVLKIKAREVGYYAVKLDRKGIDLRTVIGCEVTAITDEGDIKRIHEASLWC